LLKAEKTEILTSLLEKMYKLYNITELKMNSLKAKDSEKHNASMTS